ncbi:unnamed protein product, partial [Closterium sp. NIES-54]
ITSCTSSSSLSGSGGGGAGSLLLPLAPLAPPAEGSSLSSSLLWRSFLWKSLVVSCQRELLLAASSLRQSQPRGSRHRECWLCGDPDHLSFKCPNRSDSDNDDAKGGRDRFGSRCPCRGRNQPRKEKQSTKSSTSAKDAGSFAGGKGRDNEEAS